MLIGFLILISLAIGKNIIHVVPHSHDDPGWVKSFDEYYYQDIIRILPNTIQSLNENPKRKFVFSEISFFKPWYMNQTEQTKKTVKQLIKEKRFEFVNGGYVMEDEATCYYQDAINQLRLGMDFLYNEFQIVPKIGWFLDQFGHSASHGYIFEQFHYDTLVFGRANENFKKERKATKDLQFLWKPLNAKRDLFVHSVYDYFCPPPVVRNFANENLLNYNQNQLQAVTNSYIRYLQQEALGFKHNHSLLMYGCDFSYTIPNNNFKNIEGLMDYANLHYKNELEIKYSTVEEYFDAVRNDLKNVSLNQHEGDFFPYVDPGRDVWTGYFTSRPFLKGAIREKSILYSLSSYFILDFFIKTRYYNSQIYELQTSLQVALAINQHHDAIAGTAKTYVSNDYMSMLDKGSKEINKIYEMIMKNMFNIANITLCLGNGKSQMSCNEALVTDLHDNTSIGIINPGLNGKTLITFEYSSTEIPSFSIYDSSDELIEKDDICIPRKRCYSLFFVNLLKEIIVFPLKIKASNDDIENNNMTSIGLIEQKTLTVLSKSLLIDTITYSKSTNEFNITLFQHENSNFQISFKHGYYKGAYLDGAYVFSPDNNGLILSSIDYDNSFLINSTLSTSLVLRFSDSFLLITFFKEPFFIHLISLLDAIPENYKIGNDYILLVNSSIDNIKESKSSLKQTSFWTDATGMRLVERTNTNLRLAENFYPITTEISIKDHSNPKKQISLLTDRPQGGTSLNKGEIMVMINRFSKFDDRKGLEEKLYEPQSASGLFSIKHIISFNNREARAIADNYFIKSPLLFRGNYKKEVSTVAYSELRDIFITPSNIQMEVLFLSKKKIIIQFFNSYDDYYHDEQNKESTLLSIVTNEKIYIEECSVNGLYCHMIDKHRNTLHYRIEPQNFKVFKLSIR